MNVDELADLARRVSRIDFAAMFPHLFLVFRNDEGASNPPPSFNTELASPGDSPRRVVAGGMSVVAVAKSKESPYSDRISIGRARNCDVVLRHASVSKLHAHVSRAKDGTWMLTDKGSQNGTEVNGAKMSPNESIAIVSGYVVVFGSLLCRVADGNEVHGVVLRLSSPRRP
jgi:hypothetical protein